MDSSAIQTIQQTAIEAQKANRLDTHTPAILLRDHDGRQSVHSIEHLQATRSRFRGRFKTSSLQDFMAYVIARAGAVGFIDVEAMAASVIFNLAVDADGNPIDDKQHIAHAGHADHLAMLTLKRSSAFDALCQATTNNLAFTQKAMVEWLEDWSDYLRADYPDQFDCSQNDPSGIKKALTALRKVKIKATGEAVHTDKSFGTSRSALEDIEASSEVGLPRGFRLACQPYDDFDTSTFYLRLGVNPDPEKPSFKLRWPHANRDMETLGHEFKIKLHDGIGDKATLLLGAFDPGK